MKKKVICVISARGGSKGLPNKNIKKLINKPLIAWSIEQAKKTKEIDRVVVCTDSKKIQSIAIKAGAEVPFLRPKNLSTSQVGKFKVFKYALNAFEKYYKEDNSIAVSVDDSDEGNKENQSKGGFLETMKNFFDEDIN